MYRITLSKSDSDGLPALNEHIPLGKPIPFTRRWRNRGEIEAILRFAMLSKEFLYRRERAIALALFIDYFSRSTVQVESARNSNTRSYLNRRP